MINVILSWYTSDARWTMYQIGTTTKTYPMGPPLNILVWRALGLRQGKAAVAKAVMAACHAGVAEGKGFSKLNEEVA